MSNLNPSVDHGAPKSADLFVFEQLLKFKHFSKLARVISYEEGLATVQPLAQRVDTDGSASTRPTISSVPIIELGGGGYRIPFDIQPDDLVLLIHPDRDISSFDASAPNIYEPASLGLRYDNCVAIPWGAPSATNAREAWIPVGTADVQITSNYQWVGTGITIPEGATWFYINFGRAETNAQQAGDWHTVRGSALRGLNDEAVGTNVTSQTNHALLFHRAHGDIDFFVGKSSTAELLVTSQNASVGALGLQIMKSSDFYREAP